MVKKEFDLFGIILGLIIGCVLGYFVFSQIQIEDKSEDQVVSSEEIHGTIYSIQLGNSTNVSSLDLITNRLDVLGIYYQIYQEADKYYIFNSIYDNLEKAQTQKQIMESYGFNVTIRSDYILDLPNTLISSTDEYNFYCEAINNLLNSLKEEEIIISEIYYTNPVNIEIFSNLTVLKNIKNNEIKSNYQLNTFCLLLKKLK